MTLADQHPASRRLVVAAEEAGGRLDRVLADHVAELSRSRLKALVLDGQVAIDGRTIRDPGHHVNAGDAIIVTVPPPEPAAPLPEAIPLNIVYEDDAIIVIDKPRGLVVHPAAGNWTGTLVNALIAHCGESLSGIGGVRRPGIVHRLDKDTTGLMVVAKTDRAHRVAGRPVRRSRPHGPAAARLSGVRLGRSGPAEGHDRQADRPPPAGPRQDGGARGRAGGHHPLGGAGALPRGPTASRSRASSRAGWRPAAPTRSGCIWRPSATRCWATSLRPGLQDKGNSLLPKDAQAALRRLEGRRCTPIYWLWNIRWRASSCVSARNSRRTCSVYVRIGRHLIRKVRSSREKVAKPGP